MEPVEKLPEMTIEYLDTLAQTLRESLPDNSCRSQLGLILYSQLRRRWIHASWELTELLFENILYAVSLTENEKNEVQHWIDHREYGLALEALQGCLSNILVSTYVSAQLDKLRKHMGLEPWFVAVTKGES
jgi:hypothetical protein